MLSTYKSFFFLASFSISGDSGSGRGEKILYFGDLGCRLNLGCTVNKTAE